ncbi:MAG: lytic murein transglycosylase B [Gammaproteobacteria bacterium]|nr:lytic murein transglycosylase B [Gammaproteobacteria bacterium]
MRHGLFGGLLCAFCAAACAAPAAVTDRADVSAFLSEVAARHGISIDELTSVFRKVRFSDRVLKAISEPAETLPWYRYREIFLQPDRIELGVEFWRQNGEALRRAESAYGVPAEIIVAIIGVETRYGRNIGDYRVIDALATLAFDFPQRGEFFRDELEQYLLLTREQNMDPLGLKGSYAGAMGIPQFIASSYRRFAVDFDIDGVTDIWKNPTDAIGSVGNYFREHGWLTGGLVTLPVSTRPDLRPAVSSGLEPDLTRADLDSLGVTSPVPPPAGEKVKLLEFETGNGPEYWLGFRNFYVITRYNHSPLYAMAVFQLARSIREMHEAASASRGRDGGA